MLHFDSDYMEGAHPAVMQRLLETNLEQSPGYGCDTHTKNAERFILNHCGLDSGKVYFLIGGTQTNATVIDGVLARHEGVLAAETAHINVHEAGAIEASGHKVITLPQHDGKIDANDVKRFLDNFFSDETHEHMVAPGMLYISHPTETGTLYSLDELKNLHEICTKAHIPLYMDGARLSYGLAASDTDVTLKDIAQTCDLFYIGGTKTGTLFGEALVVRQPEMLPHFTSLVKQHGALLAKGRLLGVQFETLFSDGLYLRIARHAIEMAMKLKRAFIEKGYKAYIDSPTNQQFFIIPNEKINELKNIATFELWGPIREKETPVRFVTSWATKECDVDSLISQL